MLESFAAVYESGVLKPADPLPLSEGAHVHITIVEAAAHLNGNGETAGQNSAAAGSQQVPVGAPNGVLLQVLGEIEQSTMRVGLSKPSERDLLREARSGGMFGYADEPSRY